MDKSKQNTISNTTETDQFIRTANRYILLTEILTDEGAIPVVVNGDISTKGSTKPTNRSAFRQETSVKTTDRSKSHRETSRHDGANLKKSNPNKRPEKYRTIEEYFLQTQEQVPTKGKT